MAASILFVSRSCPPNDHVRIGHGWACQGYPKHTNGTLHSHIEPWFSNAIQALRLTKAAKLTVRFHVYHNNDNASAPNLQKTKPLNVKKTHKTVY